jgi:phytoene dehydrogenase-like protein
VLDAVIIGSGFGGLGAALSLAERGARVGLCETLKYPGGCAGTFRRDGYAFEAGATLFSGLAQQQVFGRVAARHGLSYSVDWLDPVLTLRTASFTLPVPRERERLVQRMQALMPHKAEAVQRFFVLQAAVADVLWSLFDSPQLLPPFGAGNLLQHLLRSPHYLPLLPLIGKPLGGLLARLGFSREDPLYTFARAACQITVQCDAALAEAPFALAAMDYFFRGTGHIRGGIGQLASALLGAVQKQGGLVHLGNRARSIVAETDGYLVRCAKHDLRGRSVVANLVPAALTELCGGSGPPALDGLTERVQGGYGAVMLYRVIAQHPELPEAPFHLELVDDARAPFETGNHVFASVSGCDETERAPAGQRTITISTHVSIPALRALSEREQAAWVAEIQARMRATLQKRAPELDQRVLHEITASPRTFARFTGRPEGLVGGIPRTAGLHNYAQLGPFEAARGLYLVGDSVFPGQSTLATFLSGARTAEAIP